MCGSCEYWSPLCWLNWFPRFSISSVLELFLTCVEDEGKCEACVIKLWKWAEMFLGFFSFILGNTFLIMKICESCRVRGCLVPDLKFRILMKEFVLYNRIKRKYACFTLVLSWCYAHELWWGRKVVVWLWCWFDKERDYFR